MNDPQGRYANQPVLTCPGPDGRPVAYLSRRLLPDPAAMTIAGVAALQPGERLDSFSARVQGVATAWWRIADAHRVIDPRELEDPALQLLKVPVPEAGGGSGA